MSGDGNENENVHVRDTQRPAARNEVGTNLRGTNKQWHIRASTTCETSGILRERERESQRRISATVHAPLSRFWGRDDTPGHRASAPTAERAANPEPI